MSKRKFEEAFGNFSQASSSRREPSNHSIDSDEEDDEDSKDNDILAAEDIEGQEEGAVGMKDGVQMTPFNVKEELEEGHFDTHGMYHWKKEDTVRDHWVDNYDFTKVYKPAKTDKYKDTKQPDYETCNEPTPFNLIGIYKEMLKLMEPKESVSQALRRLGGIKHNLVSDRWKKKKAGINVDLTDEEKADKEKCLKLTELSNNILYNTGNVNIYQQSYEEICHEITSWDKRLEKKDSPKKEALDMYSDDFEAKEQERLNEADGDSSSDYGRKELGDITRWEFKLSKCSDQVKGPYDSQFMQNFVTSDNFHGEIWVRKANSGGEFCSSKRIDFDLYL